MWSGLNSANHKNKEFAGTGSVDKFITSWFSSSIYWDGENTFFPLMGKNAGKTCISIILPNIQKICFNLDTV
jgi:hypothetical protein